MILQEDGRRTTADMARTIGVAEPTIRRKLNRLLDEQIVKLRAISDPVRLGFNAPAFIGLDVERSQLEAVADKLCSYPMVEDVVILTGPYDILIRAAFESSSHLYDFVLNELSKLEGIRDTHSFLIMRNLKHADLRAVANDADDDA